MVTSVTGLSMYVEYLAPSKIPRSVDWQMDGAYGVNSRRAGGAVGTIAACTMKPWRR